MYIDLVEKIPEDDKKRLDNYIRLYGTEEFIGVEKWLQSWSHSNQKLYKLLGNNLIYKQKISIEKSATYIAKEINSYLNERRNEFKNSLYLFYSVFLKQYRNYYISEDRVREKGFIHLSSLLDDMIYTNIWSKEKIGIKIKLKGLNNKKCLQLQEDMKPIRALQKILNYFKEDNPKMISDESWTKIFKTVEDFRLKLSMITNDKNLVGNLCFSIHPLDFLTMSDNSYGWSSCMSWRENGCYHLGTVEMMNSNNVVCCYLEGKEPFFFAGARQEEEENEKKLSNESIAKALQGENYSIELNTWNNKKWRVLGYINKNIVMSGKSYPYYSEEMSKKVIEILKDLAEKNLNWFYSFGPERYKDMIYINSLNAMENNRIWIKSKSMIKHNILWDTKAMYNDMLNDSNYDYWCYRNKVKHNVIYSVSGKAPCLCCGESAIFKEDFDWCDDYNDRYSNNGMVVCNNCADQLFSCDFCQSHSTACRHYLVQLSTGETIRLCENCFQSAYRYCPCCGEPYLINLDYFIQRNRAHDYLYYIGTESKDRKFFEAPYVNVGVSPVHQEMPLKCHIPAREYNIDKYLSVFIPYKKEPIPYLEKLYMCQDCFDKNFKDKLTEKTEIKIEKYKVPSTIKRYIVDLPGSECEKYFLRNQKTLSNNDIISHYKTPFQAKLAYIIEDQN